jgi:hypothetical protein
MSTEETDAPGSEDEEFEEEEDEDEAIEAAAAEEEPARLVPPPVAAPAAPKPKPAPSRRRGRPPGRTTTEPVQGPMPVSGDTRDAVFLWPQILGDLKAKGFGPEYVSIRVKRIGQGPLPSDAVEVGTIQGESVCGNESVSAGDDLARYVTEVFHLTKRGPAKYLLRVFYKSGAQWLRDMELRLDDPESIIAAQRRAADWNAGRGASAPPPVNVGHRQMGGLGSLPQQQQMQSAQPASDFFDQLQKYEQWRQGVIASGAPAPPQIQVVPAQPLAPPVAQPPPVPVLSPEDSELLEDAKFRQRAKRLGYIEIGALPPPTPPTVAATTQGVQSPVGGIRDILRSIKDLTSLKGEIASTFGIEIPEETDIEPAAAIEEVRLPFKPVAIPMVQPFGRAIYYPRDVEGGAVEWAQSFFAANPETSVELGLRFLQGVAKAVDQTSFGKVLEKLASQSGAAVESAKQAAAVGVVGTGQPSQPALNGQHPRRSPDL